MTDYTTPQPCGCSLDGRCPVHVAMMRDLREQAYEGPSTDTFHIVGSMADGFGAPGAHYGDWSAWRDSSIPALEAMWRKLGELRAAEAQHRLAFDLAYLTLSLELLFQHDPWGRGCALAGREPFAGEACAPCSVDVLVAQA